MVYQMKADGSDSALIRSENARAQSGFEATCKEILRLERSRSGDPVLTAKAESGGFQPPLSRINQAETGSALSYSSVTSLKSFICTVMGGPA